VNARTLDLLVAGAWPAREHVPIGQWVARLDAGVTRRANSVLPHGTGAPPAAAQLDSWIDAAGELYRQHGLVPCVQVSGACWPASLEERLAIRGWTTGIDRTLLLVGSLEPIPATWQVTLESRLTDRWLAAWWELDGRGGAPEREIAAALLERIPCPVAFASVTDGDRIVGVAVGALVGETLVPECVATAEGMRRRGVARAALGTLAAWAQAHGSRTSLLAVQETNEAALALYATLGLTEAGAYSYSHLDP
jgi:GNAT superfamily N-acetyltransferase